MFDIGLQELLVIAILVVIFFPAEDLPGLFRTAGRAYAKVRRASDDLRRAFNAEVARAEADMRADDLRARQEAARRAREEQAALAEASAQTGAAAEAPREASEGAAAPAPSTAPAPDEAPAQETVPVPPAPRLPPGLRSTVSAPAPVVGVTRPPPGAPPAPTVAAAGPEERS